MCTLSLVPIKKKSKNFIVTSNRDEAVDRETLPPKTYRENGVGLCYPKDEKAGGTWIGVSSKKRLACLMNGAFKPHRRGKKYRKSRGVVLKELLLAEKGKGFLQGYDLEQIEPFTIINIEWENGPELFKMVWDGKEKHFENLPWKPHIWSASMLYSEVEKREREVLFEDFLNAKQKDIKPGNSLLDFHRRFILDRGKLKTTSITQFTHRENQSKMRYLDLLDGREYIMGHEHPIL